MDDDESIWIPDASKDCSVRERCQDQRAAFPGEPRCIICGRYGEYICDETDDDICSIECKNALLVRHCKDQTQPPELPCRLHIPVRDECFYVRDCSKSDLQTADQAEALRRKINMHVKGDCVPDLLLSFSSRIFPQKLEENLSSASYEIPTPVQMQTIPAALNGRNLLVSADTGSGKTASFIVPIVTHCSLNRAQHLMEQKKPLAIVLTPTRELCIQVEEQAKVLGKGLPFKTALVVGGDAMAKQLHRIQKGVELIIATPGRLIDLLSKHDIELDEVSTLVLDEVDCMLQRGFRDQVLQIYRALPRCQILMFSATITSEVEKMASSIAKDLIFISVGTPSCGNLAVKQLIIWVESKQKKQKLFDILTSKQHFQPPLVVFVGSRLGADLLSEAIHAVTGLKALAIHGEKGMHERRDALRLFLSGEVSVIVSTGLLGRGMDLVNVRQVIIFDMPNSMKEYVHQIGRASRLGEEGTAMVFVNMEDKKLFGELASYLKTSGAVVPRELALSQYSGISHPCKNRTNKRKFGL